MKTPAELAARLRKMVLAAQHHYSPQGKPMRSIVVSPEWLEDMADAANALEHQSLIVAEFGTTRGPAKTEQPEACRYPSCQFTGCAPICKV